MARVQILPDGTIPVDADGLTYGLTAGTFDVFLSNQGEGALRANLSWEDGDFTSVFIPPQAHRPAVDIPNGGLIVLDSNEVIQIVVTRTGTASADLTVTGRKSHTTTASVGNDFVAIGGGIR